MIRLPQSLNAWNTPDFEPTLKREIEALDARLLPLQQGLSRSSCVADTPHTVVLLGTAEDGLCISVRVGIFYGGIVAGCSCADDPTPQDQENEYCEVRVDIDKSSGEATVTLWDGAP